MCCLRVCLMLIVCVFELCVVFLCDSVLFCTVLIWGVVVLFCVVVVFCVLCLDLFRLIVVCCVFLCCGLERFIHVSNMSCHVQTVRGSAFMFYNMC